MHADFDGDGRTDVSVWRPDNGTWYVTPTGGGRAFGTAGDLPVEGDFGEVRGAVAVGAAARRRPDRPEAADYDGDGRTDIAVFRPSTGSWYVLRSSDGAVQGQAWGLGSDIAVPGDYDGDGKADYAVFRPSGGIWSLHLATGEERYVTYGRSTDVPIPGIDANR